MIRAGLIQLSSSDDPTENTENVMRFVDEAADRGAAFILTPEVTNCLSTSRTHQAETLVDQENDPMLAALRSKARERRVTILAGSIALKTNDPDGRFANRSFLIGPEGEIIAAYDKIHMFDVQVSETETYHESAGYRPGDRAVVAQTPFGAVGLTVCYDIRFPHLYRTLAKAGAQIITVPSAFSPVTGAAHWETLLRARAIETGCFILAPAQTGRHEIRRGRPRSTYGHSMVVSPWGDVLADAGTEPGITLVDLDLSDVDDARGRIPSLQHDRDYRAP